MTDDEQAVETAYLDAAAALANTLGLEKDDELGGGWLYEPKIDRDRLPASVLTAGENALRYLLVALSILDTDVPDVAMTADEYLARLTEADS